MILLNCRGQAYSTFKLLIAAIVALSILMILLPIIGSIFQIFQDNPADKTIELLNAIYNKPDEIRTTARDVTFTPGMVLSASTLAASVSGLSADQICLSLGDFEEDKDNGFSLTPVELDNGKTYHRIRWNGSSNQNTKIAVTCNINKSLLETSIRDTMFEDWAKCDNVCEAGRCCLVALITP